MFCVNCGKEIPGLFVEGEAKRCDDCLAGATEEMSIPTFVFPPSSNEEKTISQNSLKTDTQNPQRQLLISSSTLKEMKAEEDRIIAEYISRPDPFYSQFYCAGHWKPNPFFRELSTDPELFEQVTLRLHKSTANLLPKVHRSIILLKALDSNRQPLLLHYFSGRPSDGWRTWLLPNVDRDVVNPKKNFLETMADYTETLLGLTNETITIHDLNALSICVKTNRQALKQEVRVEPRFFAFRYYYATLSKLPERLLKRNIAIPQGSFARRLQWFYSEEMASGADNNKMLESNADVIKTIYDVCKTLLVSIPEASLDKRIID